MAETNINCPHCAQPISVTPEHANLTFPCPHCAQEFTVPELPSARAMAGLTTQAPSPKLSTAGYWVGAIGIPAFIWLMVVVEVVFGRKLSGFRLRKVDPDDDPMMAVTIALIATVLAPIVAYFFYRRAKSVSENAMEVIGVVKKAGIQTGSMVNVTFLYEVGGKRYKKRKSLDAIEGGYHRGKEIELVVDSRNPGRCYLKQSFYRG